jgi:hypothetical protein
MAGPPNIDWNAVIADPRFQTLHRKKQGFLTGLMVFSVAFYFLLPIGAAYFQDLFKVKVWGVINSAWCSRSASSSSPGWWLSITRSAPVANSTVSHARSRPTTRRAR